MRIHELKTWTAPFGRILIGEKKFEIRKNDRDFKVGDYLRLMEWVIPVKEGQCPHYTGRECHARVDYILPGGQFGLEEGYVAMSITKISK